MLHIQWKESYNTGIKKIDDQHRSLIEIINQMIDVINEDAGAAQLTHPFKRLAEYAMIHFRTEENYMKETHYPSYLEHRQEHKQFVEKILAFNQRFEEAESDTMAEMVDFLKEWYVDHIMVTDKKYGPHLKKHLPYL